MGDVYDASAPPPPPPSSPDELSRMVERDAEARLTARLASLRTTAERFREEDAARDEDIPDWLLEALERLSGAEDAPLLFASLHRRVHDGTLTWQQVYRSPSPTDGSMSLIGEALKERNELRLQTTALLREERDAAERERP